VACLRIERNLVVGCSYIAILGDTPRVVAKKILNKILR
jgi:hypothetical protein